jgi:hypothetical protein
MKDTVPGDSNDSHTDVLADCFAPVVSFRAPNSRGSVQFQVNPGRLAAAPRGYLTAIAQTNSASLKVRRKSWPRRATQADRALQKLDEEDAPVSPACATRHCGELRRARPQLRRRRFHN